MAQSQLGWTNLVLSVAMIMLVHTPAERNVTLKQAIQKYSAMFPSSQLSIVTRHGAIRGASVITG